MAGVLFQGAKALCVNDPHVHPVGLDRSAPDVDAAGAGAR